MTRVVSTISAVRREMDRRMAKVGKETKGGRFGAAIDWLKGIIDAANELGDELQAEFKATQPPARPPLVAEVRCPDCRKGAIYEEVRVYERQRVRSVDQDGQALAVREYGPHKDADDLVDLVVGYVCREENGGCGSDWDTLEGLVKAVLEAKK